MLKALAARLRQGYRTGSFPDRPPVLPDRFHGRPEVNLERCTPEVRAVCPTGAFGVDYTLDTGRCIFCGRCAAVCPDGVKFTGEYRLGSTTREGLRVPGVPPWEGVYDSAIRSLCGKSLKIRQISAGGCGACELDFNVLSTLAWDIGRFGIQVVASPRHADALLVTGPVTDNMRLALEKSYAAMPRPCFVIACGACAVSGGLYADSELAAGGVDKVLPVDLFIPGCPPHPATVLEALLRMIERR